MNLDEGGGKAKHRWNHGNKPYSRPGASTDKNPSLRDKLHSVASFFMPSWMPVLLGWPNSASNEESQDTYGEEEEEETVDVESTLAPSTADRLPPIGISPAPKLSEPAISARIVKTPLTGYEPLKEGIAENGSEYSAHSLSTSGCSSMRDNQPDVRASTEEFSTVDNHNRRRGIATARAPLRSSLAKAAAQKRKRDAFEGAGDQESDMSNSRLSHSALWSDDSMTQIPHSRPQPTSRGNKPTFNVSGFGSPSWGDRSLLNSSIHNSPFYSGATTYMGASASRHAYSADSFAGTPSKRQRVQPRPVPTNHRTAGMSTTAKKILDALEKMSTPLADAKKIPMSKHYMDSSIFSKERTLGGPPRKRLMLPGETSIARNLHPLNARTASHSASVFPPVATPRPAVSASASIAPASKGDRNPSRSPGKMKSAKKATFHYSSKTRKEDDDDEIADFTFSSPLPAIEKTKVQPRPSLPVIPTTSSKTFQNFSFIAPAAVNSTPVKLKTKTKSEDNTQATVSLSASSELKSGSVLDVLLKKPTPPEKPLTVSKPSTVPKPGDGDKSSSSTTSGTAAVVTVMELPATPVTTASAGFGDQFKPPPGNWNCPVCMISNRSDVTSCAACTTPKPGTKPAPALPVTQTTNSFGDKFKPAAGSWECDACMVRNASKDTKCAACETVRAGSIPTTTSSSGVVTSSGFKPGAFATAPSTSAPTFKFGFPNPTTTIGAAATSSAAGGFSFGGTAATVSASAPASSGFVFGAKSGNEPAKPSSGGFVFGSTSTVPTTESTVKGFSMPSEGAVTLKEPVSVSDKNADSAFTLRASVTSALSVPSCTTVGSEKVAAPTPTLSQTGKLPVSAAASDQPTSSPGFNFSTPISISDSTTGFSLPTSTETTAKPSVNFFFKPPDDAEKSKKSSDDILKQPTATSGSGGGGGFTFSLSQDTTKTSTKRELDAEEPSSKQSKSALPNFNSFGSSTSRSTSAVSFTFGTGSPTGMTKTSSQAQPTTGTPGALFSTGPATMSSATVSTPALTSALISSKPSTSIVAPEASKPSITPFGSPSSTNVRTVSIPMFGSASMSTSMPSMVGSATTMTTSVFGSIPSSSTFLSQATTTHPVFGTASTGIIATTAASQGSLPPFSTLQNTNVPVPPSASTTSAPSVFGNSASASTIVTTATTTTNQPFSFSGGVGSFGGFGNSSATAPAVNFGVPASTTAAPTPALFQSSSGFGSNLQTPFTSPTTAAATPFQTVATTLPTGTFTFGAPNPAPFSAPTPAFGAPAATTSAAAAGFGSTGPLFGSPAPATGFGGFSAPTGNATSLFGGNAPVPAAGGFNFSATPSLPFGGSMQQAASNEVFTFSANPQPNATQQPDPAQSPFGQQPAANPAASNPLVGFSATPQLNFGSVNSGNSVFQFSAPPPSGTNPFEPRSNSTGARTIRRAVRRRKP